MSIVVNNSFKLKENISMNELNNLLIELNKKISIKSKEICEKNYAKFLQYILDNQTIYNTLNDEKYNNQNILNSLKLLYNYDCFPNEFYNIPMFNVMTKKNLLNNHCKILVYIKNNKTVLVINSRNIDLYREVFNEFESYDYFNNYDKPNEFTNEEWEERRVFWNNVLDLPCLTYDYDTNPILFSNNKIIKYMEDMYEERINLFKDEIKEETLRNILPKTYNIDSKINLKDELSEEINDLIEKMAQAMKIDIVKSKDGINPFIDIKKYTTHEERVQLAIKSWVAGSGPFPTKENTP